VNKQPEKTLTPEDLRARHEARVDRLALASMPALWTRIVDLKGRPMVAVRGLSPERAIADFPRVVQLRWLHANGRWADIGSGANGDGVIALVEWLSCAPREKCVALLEELLAELGERAA
jgi:hypothetical protein